MAVKVLQQKSEFKDARCELRRRGISYMTDSRITRLVHRLKLQRIITVGHILKSWDILTTVDFIQERLQVTDPILDIGAYTSEILCVLHRLKYTALTGIDLEPNVVRMPFADKIRYEVGDFMRTHFVDETFAAITAISVIEHGFESNALLKEITRLLRPGGYFIASFDYWPNKIDTSGNDMYGMNWCIFSRGEVLAFLDKAKEYGLSPYGPVKLETSEAVIKLAGKSYTFAWLVLQKTPRVSSRITGGIEI